MTLPNSGAISLADIQLEFGGSNPISISEYYRGGGLVPNAAGNNTIPTSGAISFSNFYNTASTDLTPDGLVEWVEMIGNDVENVYAAASTQIQIFNGISAPINTSITFNVESYLINKTPGRSVTSEGFITLVAKNGSNTAANTVTWSANNTNYDTATKTITLTIQPNAEVWFSSGFSVNHPEVTEAGGIFSISGTFINTSSGNTPLGGSTGHVSSSFEVSGFGQVN